ncbi:polysaccharide biosynthesis protein [Natrinema pellirubrum DSM 15624]|uniref:Membrane protein involved in the export of O-antigen and teichoic acid n=1 Tax=Natrinema pellirubrum (strain DSM 15624 / CIP 106293 / JCM 10476 / NCIMB 786 / 157) TaxID=797303 RepID=L0JMV0_NATP1|nr:flippase [Natrinema pellirubrum]AGB32835.1 membrane protein involved in the export of O-antigen and teichoic acid [Natrinema pellirubrum DSM 15624]ELY75596.1 polysaccharide biosynthesis protein [Natrinema pellirubrum DSM 15624]
MNRSIASGVVSVVSAKVVVLVVTALSTPLLYRLLGAAAFGEYAFLLSVFAIYMIFVSSGVTDGVRKFLAEDRAAANWSEHVVGFYLRLAITLSVLGALLLVVATRVGLVGRAFGSELTSYFYVLAALVVTAQFRDYARKTLMGFGLERYSEPLKIVDKVGFVVVAVPLVYLGAGVFGALAGQLVASTLVAAIGLALVHRRVSLSCLFSRPTERFPRRQMLTFNSMSIALVFLLMSLYHIDIVMLQRFTESSAVGNYKAALTLAEFLWFIPMALQTVFVHSTSELWSQNRLREISDLASRTTRYTFLLTAVMAVGLAALADIAVPIYFGADATPAIAPLLLLLPGSLGFALARPILAISQGKGMLRYPVAATGAAAVINVVLNVTLIPRFGMHGAAVATSVGYGSMFLFHCWSARLVGFDPLSDARLGRSILATVLAAGPIVTLSTAIGNPWLALAVVPPAGFVIFVVFALLVGALDPAEPFEVLSTFPDPLGAKADAIRGWLAAGGTKQREQNRLHSLLFVVGLSLLVSGLTLGLLGSGIGSVTP